MVRTQIHLTDAQHSRLKVLAAEQGTSIAELIRQAVDQVLDRGSRAALWDRLWEAAGTAQDPSGATDVATRHDNYLAEAFARDLGLR